jgi:uncharacterized protein (UPF0332 family)
MNSRDFLTLAQTLLGDRSEAAWRSAVSRAYYAAFHTARELLEALGFSVPHGERAHGYLWLRLSNCGDPQVQNTGAALNTLRQDRNRADYDLHRSLTLANATRSVRAAKQCILLLDTTATAPTRISITDAMKIYERDVLQEITWPP